jgi:cytochrome c biogenesis protein CcdA
MTVKFNKLPVFTQQAVQYFGFLMVIFYLVLGFLFIFSTKFFPELNRIARLIFGVILVIYGIFRAFRAFKSLSHDNPS